MKAIAPALTSGLLAGFIAYSSSFAVNVQGLRSVGATPEQAASAILAMSVAMGATCIVYSWRTRIPINIAWATPGAAFLAASGVPAGGFPAAVGAFVFAGLLMLAVGLIRPLARAIERFPRTLANAMLAGILFDLTLAPVRALREEPVAAGIIALVFVLVAVWRRPLAVPAAALVTIAIIATNLPEGAGATIDGPTFAGLVFPEFTLEAIVGLGLPLFLISMASQNLPGLAILQTNGFRPAPRTLFVVVGLLTLIFAFAGAHAFSVAAIVAALCVGEAAGPDKSLRYFAGISCGATYIAFGLSAGVLVVFAGAAPLLIAALAGLALIATFAAAVKGAMEREDERDAAAIAFLVTASGIAFFGFSAAVWGLLAGGGVMALGKLRARSSRSG